MKPIYRQLLIGLAGCITLTLIFGYSLSIAVNYGITKFEERAGEFLPGTSSDAPADSSPLGQ
jgi:hypothetical protein